MKMVRHTLDIHICLLAGGRWVREAYRHCCGAASEAGGVCIQNMHSAILTIYVSVYDKLSVSSVQLGRFM